MNNEQRNRVKRTWRKSRWCASARRFAKRTTWCDFTKVFCVLIWGGKQLRGEEDTVLKTEMFRVNLVSILVFLLMFLWPPLLYRFCGVVGYIFFRHLLRWWWWFVLRLNLLLFFVFVFFFGGAFLVLMTGEREKVWSGSVFRLVVFLEFLQRRSIDFAPGFD